MSVAEWIKSLYTELRALKSYFEKSANSISLYEYNIPYSSVKNTLTVKYDASTTGTVDETERRYVTLNTSLGISTIAKIEVSVSNTYEMMQPHVRRVPYAGGARWMITNSPPSTYETTNFTIKILSIAPGTVSISEVSS